ncbi:MAG: xanthine dehydrogenase family protein molybdopterin-binding subunit [Paracoccus sp. (in: a-proteobacteria)]|uniref:xanthine dehydrogenase family protein molybdopterin-binding subunit n=1 Tax=Paracoccus sp. TaxID=267 RepID=UPI0026E0CF97|nr:xanthine dehydrogenase family protein molybdopterin-binding subunit [Paracoccus sp. (in: a-proteobacteria)]MDO5622987.1 xanthine dehydrogenase family protein molybdopterin-binding subunit [Paracoccus sp. (in: a-proteobacteria)]
MNTHVQNDRPLNVSRRGFLGAAGALILSVSVPLRPLRAQPVDYHIVPGTRVQAFLEIRPDNTVLFRNPFAEGGQGVYTALAQIVGEELDLDPTDFVNEVAPPGPDYLLTGGARFTGGSMSVRMSYDAMRNIGAAARMMLMQAAARRLNVPVEELTTEPGRVIHAASSQSLSYGELAEDAAALPVPSDVPLRDPADFRWIGQPVARLDTHDKATGKAQYGIDLTLPDMLHGAVQHAPRLGEEPGDLTNEAEVAAMPGVHSVHRLPGAVAVLADSWWRARRAVETLNVEWQAAAPGTPDAMPADFSSEGYKASLRDNLGTGTDFETAGDMAALDDAATRIEAVYDAPHLAHAQLEPPSALVRWNDDGTLELWIPNQAPEMFQADIARRAGIAPEQVILHSTLLGGFFGRHFLYASANPFPQAVELSRAAGRPVKLIWSREEEFLRDALRPISVTRFRAGLDASGQPLALEGVAVTEGATERWYGKVEGQANPSALEGIAGKQYAIPNRRIAQEYVRDPAVIGFWRSVGHSMNDYFYECFFDEMAGAGGNDPYELRLSLLTENPRLTTLLEAVANLAGGWQRGPYQADDGTTRARGVAMASPFGSEAATMAEVSLDGGQARVHNIWVAIDPGSIVNPAIIEAQVRGAVALGLSATLLEDHVYENGMPLARNFDSYPILTRDMMPDVHVRIIQSGAPMGGIGEPGLPGVPPAVVNAVAVLTGEHIRSLPLAKHTLTPRG